MTICGCNISGRNIFTCTCMLIRGWKIIIPLPLQRRGPWVNGFTIISMFNPTTFLHLSGISGLYTCMSCFVITFRLFLCYLSLLGLFLLDMCIKMFWGQLQPTLQYERFLVVYWGPMGDLGLTFSSRWSCCLFNIYTIVTYSCYIMSITVFSITVFSANYHHSSSKFSSCDIPYGMIISKSCSQMA